MFWRVDLDNNAVAVNLYDLDRDVIPDRNPLSLFAG
jgi:hypothetical protein